MTQELQDGAQVLMLGLADEVLAIDARQVREILDPIPVTRVPGAKPYVASLLNVRGKVIPLADLRLRFGVPPAPITPETRFVVIEIELDGDLTTIGVIADKVYEVTELDGSTRQKTPPVGMHWRPEFLAGIAKWKDEFIVLPDMTKILGAEDG
jgi:purine-binding chemotaxis protein CheW